MLLRNRFLGTASFLFSPPGEGDGTDGGKSTVLNENTGAEDDTNTADQGGNTSADGDSDADDDGTNDGAGDGDGTNDGAGDEEDDPDLAEFTPEQRKKIQARLDRETRWRDKQLDKLHARKRTAEEDVRALETIADPARRGQQQNDPDRKFTAEEVKVEAGKLAAQTQFDENANAADAAGKAAYQAKWGPTMAKLPKLGGVDVNDMVDILATDNPHVVLFNLADPDTYERVMALPPARRRNEFVKMAMLDAPKPRNNTAKEGRSPSSATPPVVPVHNGRRTAAQQVNLFDDKATDEAWYATRNATRRKKFSDHV